MRRDALRYDLPEELIAVRPTAERDGARLLVLTAATVEHRLIRDLDRLLPAGALLVVNDTRVVPARLLGRKADTGGRVELLLVRRVQGGANETWDAMARSSKPMRPGARLVFEDAAGVAIEAEVLSRAALPPDGDGLVRVALRAEGPLEPALERVGHVPLPPYVKRADEPADRERYQTVFARTPGAVAAPTAGLHLSEALLDRLTAAGIALARVTLHVGLGTFQPVTADDLDDHPMHEERFTVDAAAVAAIDAARARAAPVVAVGTTVVRALESAADPDRSGHVRVADGATRLLVQPGYRFRVVDRLLTNFHLPESTLLALVWAFGGAEAVLGAYREAVAERYRFFSYGDAMLLQARVEQRS